MPGKMEPEKMKRIKDGDKYLVEIDVDQISGTRDAIFISNGSQEAWIPKSQITDLERDNGKLISIIIPEWLAIEKELV